MLHDKAIFVSRYHILQPTVPEGLPHESSVKKKNHDEREVIAVEIDSLLPRLLELFFTMQVY